jgi:hypothetical protein
MICQNQTFPGRFYLSAKLQSASFKNGFGNPLFHGDDAGHVTIVILRSVINRHFKRPSPTPASLRHTGKSDNYLVGVPDISDKFSPAVGWPKAVAKKSCARFRQNSSALPPVNLRPSSVAVSKQKRRFTAAVCPNVRHRTSLTRLEVGAAMEILFACAASPHFAGESDCSSLFFLQFCDA